MSERRILSLVGLSHKSAPIAVRERFALTDETLRDAVASLLQMDGVVEAMVLSTCNRVEVYLVGEGAEPARRFFLSRSPEAEGHLYERSGTEAVHHLLRVAASLDSMVVGEQQILGQLKEAYGICSGAGAAGPFLSRLCNKAFAVAKRIRRETDIGKGTSSVSQVAVELVEKIFGDLRGRTILLVGAGKMGSLAAKALAGLGADSVLVTNRSAERARALAQQVGGSDRPWSELERLMVAADVVLVSTGAPTYVVTRELAAQTMRERRQRSLCLIDLAVPRNVDPACAELEHLYSYDIDDLQKVVSRTRAMRAEESLRAEAIIEAELAAFAHEQETRAAVPVLAALRRKAEEIACVEAERTLQQVGARLDEKGRRSIEAMARAIVNKLLHAPTARLKASANPGGSPLASAVAELFGLEESECASTSSVGDDGEHQTEVAAVTERDR